VVGEPFGFDSQYALNCFQRDGFSHPPNSKAKLMMMVLPTLCAERFDDDYHHQKILV